MTLKWFKNHDEKSGVDYIAINPEHVVSVMQDETPEATQIYMVTDLVFTVEGKCEDIVGKLTERDY